MAFEAESQGQLQEFLQVISKRRWQALLPAIFILSLGIVFAAIVPKKYSVETRIELLESRVGGNFGSRSSPQASAAREIQNADQHIKNYGRVRSVIEEQDWVDYIALDTVEKYEYVKAVISDITVGVLEKKRNQEGSTFVDIAYTDVSGERAVQFLSRLTQVWIEDVVDRDRIQLTRERDVLQNQVQSALSRYDGLNKGFFDLVKEMGISVTQPLNAKVQREEDPLFKELMAARQDRDTVVADLVGVMARTKELKEDYTRQPEEIQVEIAQDAVDLAGQIADLEIQTEAARQQLRGLRPEHSRYRILTLQIEQLEATLARARDLGSGRATSKVWQANPRRSAIQVQIDVLRFEEKGYQARLDELESQIKEKSARHRRQLDDYQELFPLLSQKQAAEEELSDARRALSEKNATLTVMVEAYGRPFEIVLEPIAPPSPSEPSVVLIVAGSGFAGLGLGLFLAFFLEFSRNCFRVPSDLARVMTVPVLGAIDTILTQADLRRTRLKHILVGTSSAVFLAGIFWFTYAWAFAPETLPTGLVEGIEDIRFGLR